MPGEVATDSLTLQSIDATAGPPPLSILTATIVDPRPVRAPFANPRLTATTRRGNSPFVTLTLSITAAPNARAYRVLIASETTLRSAFGLPAPEPSSRVPNARRPSGRPWRAATSGAFTRGHQPKHTQS